MAPAPSRAISLLLLSLALLPACGATEQPPETIAVRPAEGLEPAAPVLHPLDEGHAADLRRAFDEAGDRARYVVALSPT